MDQGIQATIEKINGDHENLLEEIQNIEENLKEEIHAIELQLELTGRVFHIII